MEVCHDGNHILNITANASEARNLQKLAAYNLQCLLPNGSDIFKIP